MDDVWTVCVDAQDSSSADDSEPTHDDSYTAELEKLRERSRARIATARESMYWHIMNNNKCLECSIFYRKTICESSLRSSKWKLGERQMANYAKLQTWRLSVPVGCYRPSIHPSLFFGNCCLEKYNAWLLFVINMLKNFVLFFCL